MLELNLGVVLTDFGRHIMEIKIGYCPWGWKQYTETDSSPDVHWGVVDELHLPIKPIDTWKKSASGFTKCPAFQSYVNNTYAIKSWLNIDLNWDKNNSVLDTNLKQPQSNFMLNVHYNDFDVQKDFPIVAYMCSYVFVSNEDVWLDVFQPYNDSDGSWRLMPASFNINVWPRPVQPTFEMLSNKVSFKRGQPISYIRFRSKNQKDTFKLVPIERSEHLEKAVNVNTSVKHFVPNLSWKLMMNFSGRKKWKI